MTDSPSSDNIRYQQLQELQEKEWESLCKRCGACCDVVDEDPCEHLAQSDKGYYCDIYNNRFGLHKTISGKPFRCVPIRNILHQPWPGDQNCGYKIRLRQQT